MLGHCFCKHSQSCSSIKGADSGSRAITDSEGTVCDQGCCTPPTASDPCSTMKLALFTVLSLGIVGKCLLKANFGGRKSKPLCPPGKAVSELRRTPEQAAVKEKQGHEQCLLWQPWICQGGWCFDVTDSFVGWREGCSCPHCRCPPCKEEGCLGRAPCSGCHGVKGKIILRPMLCWERSTGSARGEKLLQDLPVKLVHVFG